MVLKGREIIAGLPSMVSLDSTTGKMIWGYQYLPHDVWDLDAASPPILTTARNNKGENIPVAVHAGKTGWVYVHDIKTGALIIEPKREIFTNSNIKNRRKLQPRYIK